MHYSECIVRLPHSYQPYDPRLTATECTATRAEVGLPADAFVFCCFNNRFKIHPGMFDAWMRILDRVSGSVLWLGESAKPVADNLRREAQSRGVAPERLRFADRMASRDAHIARYQLADLFLDTLPFNAHATASDALWAGLPLLTCLGNTFAGRVAAGMVNAVGLPELITHDLHEYEARAVALAQQGSELPQLRERLVSGRLFHPLFDLNRYRKSLERAYERMIEEVSAARSPTSFAIAD
jgi:protein O-GlcNAc transferase